jgi:phenylacetate-CoA ligase
MSTDYWNEERETMAHEELENLQADRLRAQTSYAYENTAYFQEQLDEANVRPNDVRTIDDYQRQIPFVIKADLRERDRPQDFIAAPDDELTYVHASTGTTGKPTHQVVAEGDQEHMQEYLARYHHGAGVRENDTVLDLWLYYHLFSHWADMAYEELDATLFRRGGFPFEVENDLETISVWTDMDPDVLHVSFNGLFDIKQHLQENGLSVDEVFPSLRAIQTGGSVWTEYLREAEEEFWGVPIYDVGGPTDTLSCGVTMCEGHEENWYHWWEDLMFPEVVDFDTQEIVAPGERGELVYTHLHARGTPYLRWRSEDGVKHGGHDCVCGRDHFIGRILGRTGDRIQIDDQDIFLRDVEEVLHTYDDIRDQEYQIIRNPPHGEQDHVRIRLETDKIDDDTVEVFRDELASELGVDIAVEQFEREQDGGEWKPDKIVEEEL